ncbi:tRNA (N6-isopentenyl adenosine(37)-C2)-methylthiotransferase MiaB [Thermosulfurimonas sp. F29]|uniref:tRNA (N6-isopentenyl adenosine(37)-C2)-methylthiotransferase MiaB n=1 Tax=Thermosulfurimonas sp. F29 TaxID=2867247 RepID=UPI001C82DFFB|nr:tRNA (N6-isopentenyl adenosine(37)-C2)-methylthiotransferase MiaB [Thermosulfurimonas sp. F29]MBX6423638.1 tRNA (N6-isopentenyl adenosine(37)-C2)-methylthiotransferase MiaB [Thermosulfurimonas sp. F29]
MKRVFLKTFGCQMNEYDSERMLALLAGEYVPCEAPEEADLILINTCSVRRKAEEKVYSLVGRFRHLKARRPEVVVGVCGCVAQQEGERLVKRMPHVDLVLGTQNVHRLPEALREIEKGRRPLVLTEMRRDFVPPLILPSPDGRRPVKAQVTIMQGCDNFCSYCVVPYVRGREVSRPPEDILKEIECLVERGVREVTLLGQNVNSYGKKEPGFPTFAELIRLVAEIPGLWRIRFTTSHPKDLSEDLMRAFAEVDKLCEHLHLPVQSGSTRILRRMNRGYTRDEYLEKVRRLREICPEIALTTDIIVGFPGETEEDFRETLSLLEEVRFDEIFSFKYSDRPYARAREFSDKVPEEVKAERLERVHELQARITQEINRSYIGKTVEVLVEGPSETRPELLTGRTRTNHVVNFSAPEGLDLKGALVYVLIKDTGKHSLRGEYLKTVKGP